MVWLIIYESGLAVLWLILYTTLTGASPDPLPVEIANGSTAANQTTLIIVAAIGAIASISTAFISAFFAFMMVRVKRVAEATHSIVNHDRQVMLEAQAQALRVASLDHPGDQDLKRAWQRAEEAAQAARRGNDLPESKI